MLTDGDYNFPSISKIYEITSNSGEVISGIKEIVLYASNERISSSQTERIIELSYGTKVFRVYDAEDFRTFRKSKNGRGKGNYSRRNTVEVEKTGEIKFSMRVPVEETDRLIALHNLTPESSGVRLSKKYWTPDLTKKEWKLLDYKIDRVGEKLDQNTFWFYSNEKDVQVFCVYGIGDGTENTPLYASGGEKAKKDFEKFQIILEGIANESNRGTATSDRWLQAVWRRQGNVSSNLYDVANGRANDRNVQVHGGTSKRGGTRTSGSGKENFNGLKFSMRVPVEETDTLIALHNLTPEKLEKALDIGGFPMPSIAVTRVDIPHTSFGDITLVMDKSTVDPKADGRKIF